MLVVETVMLVVSGEFMEVLVVLRDIMVISEGVGLSDIVMLGTNSEGSNSEGF